MKRHYLFILLSGVSLILNGCKDGPVQKITPIEVDKVSAYIEKLEQKISARKLAGDKRDDIRNDELARAILKYQLKLNESYINIGFNKDVAGGIVEAVIPFESKVKNSVSEEKKYITPAHYRELVACLLTEGRLYTLVQNKENLEQLVSKNNAIYYAVYEPILERANAKISDNTPSSEREKISKQRDNEFYEEIQKDSMFQMERNILKKI